VGDMFICPGEVGYARQARRRLGERLAETGISVQLAQFFVQNPGPCGFADRYA